ncbi:MAG: desulfoferrodoxin family protein [Candidatus Goldiibacteriota bacterium]
MKELYQTADWKKEKHVPVIDVEGRPEKDKPIKAAISVGKEVSHPNKTEHHIRWISLYFLEEGEKFPYEIGTMYFSAHGESVKGADTSGVYTSCDALFVFKTEKPGTLLASSYCNIHGLWENSEKISF